MGRKFRRAGGAMVPVWSLLYSLSMADSEPGSEIARSELRASHDDRDRVVKVLRVSAGQGRQRPLHGRPAAPDVLAAADQAPCAVRHHRPVSFDPHRGAVATPR
jgi:hypothetical protein